MANVRESEFVTITFNRKELGAIRHALRTERQFGNGEFDTVALDILSDTEDA